jgi:hypothetical protein
MRIWTRNLTALLCGLTVSTAAAQTSGDWIRSDNVALIFDASNSMKAETDAPIGQIVSKQSIAVLSAKRVLDGLVDAGAGREITAIAFGNRYDVVAAKKDAARRQLFCNLDVETLLPRIQLSAQVAATTFAKISQLQPRGMTPISQALNLASTNLGAQGGAIVLITDWEDPCGANDRPPCETLRQINKSRKDKKQGAVSLQVILVPRRNGFDRSYVEGLRACTGAQLFFLTTPDEVEGTIAKLFPRKIVAPAPAPPPSPPVVQPPARIRVVQLRHGTSAQGDFSPVVLQILDPSDHVMDTITLSGETAEFAKSAGNYKARARFADGREIILPLDALEAGSERVIYVAR